MNKKEAYEIWLKLHYLCVKHISCGTCPLYIADNNDKFCSLDSLCSYRIKAYIEDRLAEDEQKASMPLKKGGPIISTGGHSNDEQTKVVVNSSALNTITDGPIFDVPKADYVAKHDNVNSPKHYCKGGLECIEVIKAQLTHEQRVGYLYGNIIKYMWRWPDKNGLEDLQKATKYLEWLQEEVKK